MRSVLPPRWSTQQESKGRIISTDTMHTQKRWCACVHAYKGYYLTIVKKNQPQMYQDLVDFFADQDADQQEWQYAKSVHKGHGRLEIREIWTSTQMNAWFETEWAGVAQVFRLRRYVKEGEKEREEIVYGFTNLTRKKANASRLLALQPAHWRIENRLHSRRDVTDSGKMLARSVLPVLLKLWLHSMEGSSL